MLESPSAELFFAAGSTTLVVFAVESEEGAVAAGGAPDDGAGCCSPTAVGVSAGLASDADDEDDFWGAFSLPEISEVGGSCLLDSAAVGGGGASPDGCSFWVSPTGPFVAGGGGAASGGGVATFAGWDGVGSAGAAGGAGVIRRSDDVVVVG